MPKASKLRLGDEDYMIRKLAWSRKVAPTIRILRQPDFSLPENGHGVEISIALLFIRDAKVEHIVQVEAGSERIFVRTSGNEKTKLRIVADQRKGRLTQRAGRELAIMAEELDAR